MPNAVSIWLSFNRMTGPLPTKAISTRTAPKLLSLDLAYNHFTGPVPDDICELSVAVTFLYFNHNWMQGPMPRCAFGGSALSNVTQLFMSCQSPPGSAAIPPYVRCPAPFGLGGTGGFSMASLLSTRPSLARVDVLPDPAHDLSGVSQAAQDIMPVFSTSVLEVESAVATALAVLMTLVLAVSVKLRKRGGLGLFDRFPQHGYVQDTIVGAFERHTLVSHPQSAASKLGGFMNLLKIAVLVFFVVYSLTSYAIAGLKATSKTAAMPEILSPGALNFTLSVAGTSVLSVQDPWLSTTLKSVGFKAAPLIHFTTNQSRYGIPLGWDGSDLSRTITMQIDGAQLAASGLNWSLVAGAVDSGELPNPDIGLPSVAGTVVAVPSTSSICKQYEFNTYMFEINGERKATQWYAQCNTHGFSPQLLIPGRAAPEAVGGPSKLLCLGNFSIFIEVVPLLQSSDRDVFSGTAAFFRKTYDLSITGTKYTMVDRKFALPGAWQTPSPYGSRPNTCPGCIAATACPAANVTLTLRKSVFGVNQTLTRTIPVIKFGPSLLASCMSLAAVFGAVYGVLAGRSGGGKPLGKWLLAARKELKSNRTTRADACAVLGDEKAPVGGFAFFSSSNASLMVCVVLPNRQLAEVRLVSTGGRGFSMSENGGEVSTIPTPAKSLKAAIVKLARGVVGKGAGLKLRQHIKVPISRAAGSADGQSDSGSSDEDLLDATGAAEMEMVLLNNIHE